MTAKFIVIEGIDGAGTTTQVALLHRALLDKGFKVLTTTEPSTGEIGSFLRNVLASRDTSWAAEELALLFTADRLDHIKREIKPALKKYHYIICDRYYHSTLAYQSKANGKNLDWLISINQPALKPALTFFLDIKVATALLRMARANRAQELFENENQLKRIHRNYHRVINELQKRGEAIIVLDGEASPQEILTAELKIIGGIS